MKDNKYFLLIIPTHIRDYLDWVKEKRKMSRAETIRKIMVEQIAHDREFNFVRKLFGND